MLTYFDVVEYLITSSFGGPQDAEQKDIRSAIRRATREVVWIRDWQYYNTHCRIVFADNWFGSVSYDAATSTVTRTSGDPFPTDSIYREMRINNIVCKVRSRTNDNTLVLDSVLDFPKDLVTATSASLYRTVYPLPADFRNMDPPVNEDRLAPLMYVSPDQAMKMERAQSIQGPPSYWTVVPYDGTGLYAVRIIGYPATVATLDFTYRRANKNLRISGHEAASRQGTISASGSTSVIGVGTAFASSMVGSVLRVGGADLPGSEDSLSPFVYESLITAVTSATTLTIQDALTFNSVKYMITDQVDCPPGIQNCMMSASEYWLARIRGNKPEQAYALYQRDLRLAMENDAVIRAQTGSAIVWDAMGWRTPLMADNFNGGSP
jgi:hypothetical protein